MTAAALDAHPLGSGVGTIEAVLNCLDTSMWQKLPTEEVRRLLAQLGRLDARLSAHRMAAARVLDASQAARSAGAASTGSLISNDGDGDRGAGEQLVRCAKRIERETTHTEKALAAGVISARQADVIARALSNLPGDVTADQRDVCERQMLKAARTLSLKDLRRRADRITDAYKPAPEVDQDENDLLQAREQRARENTQLRMWDNHDGTHSGQFTLPDAQAVMLKTALDALAAPHQTIATVDAATGERNEVGFGQSYPQRLGLAFASLCELLPADRLPSNGGVSATVTVNLDLDTLVGGVKAAGLSDGTRLSASEARRLACSAQIIPAVLDGSSLAVDLGTAQRYFNRHSRKALELRDRGCTAPGMEPSHQARSGDGGQRRPLVRGAPPHPVLDLEDHRRPRRSLALLLPPPPRPRPTVVRTDIAGRRTRRVEATRLHHVATQPPLPTLNAQGRRRIQSDDGGLGSSATGT